MEEVSKAKHYIAVNAGGRYPLLKTAQDYTEYFHEALSFPNLYETYRFIEKHGLEKMQPSLPERFDRIVCGLLFWG